MKKLINDPGAFVDEMLEGILLAHPDRLRAVGADRRSIVRADAPVAGRVGIVTGGGSGHLPVFLGFVGVGLCSGVAVGNVFSSPSMDQILEATRGVDGGAGVLYLYGNYGGDVLNFDLAGELADAEGITVETVLVADDVASAPADRADARRGVAGMFFAFKCAGAVADAGGSLDGGRGGGPACPRRHPLDGRRALADDPARRRQAHLRAGRRRDGDRHRHPRRARCPARPARDGRRGRRRPARGDRGGPGSGRGRPGRGPRQRPRRDAARGAVHPLPAASTRVWPRSAWRSTGRTSGSSRQVSRWPARR